MSFSGFDISTASDIYFGFIQCSEAYIGSTKIWPHDYSIDYFTIVSLEDNNKIKWTDSGNNNSLQYSLNNGTTWSTLSSGSSVTLNTRDKVLFKATGLSIHYWYGIGTFSSTKSFNVEGNIMSLINGDNFIGQTSLSEPYIFSRLFYTCTYLISAKKLILPATTLKSQCYMEMFYECKSLTTAPALPATTLATYCYDSMFQGCFSLTTAPSLPATTLQERCYQGMFSYCTSLTTVPVLPATTLADYCYLNMFKGCSSLTTAPELPATTLADYCYDSMFQGCSSLTTAPILPATTLTAMCYQSMFRNCSSLTNAPELPATTLASTCYNNMFRGCESLNYIKCLATDISALNCTSNWVDGVSVTGTFVKAESMLNWTTGVNGIPSGWTVQNAHDYTNDYFTIVSSSDNNTISWKESDGGISKTISISTDGGTTWTQKASDTTGVTLATLNTGDKMLVKGNNTVYAAGYYNNYFVSTGNFNVEGNIMSLIYGDNFIGQTLFTSSYIFYRLFYNCTYLISAENLILPATTLTTYCYRYMFEGCSSLTSTPELPATTLADSCYQGMFMYCSSLTTAPKLPATTLTTYCYHRMFLGCSSLTTAPELPVTTLQERCYSQMFQNCSSLTTAPELPATTLANQCYSQMFYNCTSLTTAPVLPATTLADYCYFNMFNGCTALTTAPSVLPATTLANQCYYGMFWNCISLTTAPELPATTLTNQCYRNMFQSCSSLNYIKCLATDISASNCTSGWTNLVSSSGTFIKDASMTGWTTGGNGIPYRWTVQDA